MNIFGGFKPDGSIATSLTKRFLDALNKNVMYELKAGFIKVTKKDFNLPLSELEGFAKQVAKDMEILRTSNIINKLEYHIVEGISDDAVEFIQKMAKDNGVLDKVVIILYK